MECSFCKKIMRLNPVYIGEKKTKRWECNCGNWHPYEEPPMAKREKEMHYLDLTSTVVKSVCGEKVQMASAYKKFVTCKKCRRFMGWDKEENDDR